MGGIAVWLLLGLAVALGVALVIIGYRLVRFRREVGQLSRRVEQFIASPKAQPQVNLREDALAALDNSIAALQGRLLHVYSSLDAQSRHGRDMIVELSHQLKTPLASLRLYCEMDASAHVDEQIEQIERMERMIVALLRLEKLRAGGVDFAMQLCQLHVVAHEVIEGFRPLYPNKQLLLSGEATIRCDAARMGEAMGNLIKNACAHTARNGTVWVRLSAGETSATIEVEDDGGGVPTEDLPRLFERFFRSARSSQHEGTGVGLSIARAIIRLHHGTIQASNGPKGLRVVVTLPDLRHTLKKT